MKAYCDNCLADFDKTHFNQKYCKDCKEKSRLGGFLTMEQEEIAKKYATKIPIGDLAIKVGVSNSTIDRWSRRTGISINWLSYDKDTIKKVCDFYSKNGKIKTQKKFPDVRMRSIVERYYSRLGYEPRTSKWTDEQIIEAAKMAGIISFYNQKRFFNRPNANEGSIKSLWIKKMNQKCTNINGLPLSKAKHFVKKNCPALKTDFWTEKRKDKMERSIVLWVDFDKFIKKDVPNHYKKTIHVLANFQRWLHGRNVRANISRMIYERVGKKRRCF